MDNTREHPEVVGLIPAAGLGRRVAPLPCSKEIYPVGFRTTAKGKRPKVAAHYLLERIQEGGAEKAYIILRDGKWDIPEYFGDGQWLNLDLAYLMMGQPHGTPFTLDQAYPFVGEATVLLGFPDVLFDPSDAYRDLLHRQRDTEADVVLGLFPARNPQKVDMVDTDDAGRVQVVDIKPQQTTLQYTWIIAAWTPAFTAFMHTYLAQIDDDAAAAEERYVGDVIRAALQEGMHVNSVHFPEGYFIDIGTPEALEEVVSREAAVQYVASQDTANTFNP